MKWCWTKPSGSALWPGAAAARTRNFGDHVHEGRHFPRIERHLEEFYDQPQTLWDFLPPDTVVVEWDPLILGQELQKQEEAAAGVPQGWLDQTPWEEQRRRFRPDLLPPFTLGPSGSGPGYHLPGGEKRSPGRGTGPGRGRDRPVNTRPWRSAWGNGAAPGSTSSWYP